MSDPLSTLREALAHSPENLPLRLHLAQALLDTGRWEEAEAEFRQGISKAPDDARFRLGLAETYLRQGKHSPALVVVEDLLKKPDAPASAYVLHAKLLFRSGEVQRAVSQYKAGIDVDPEAADADFAAKLGIGMDEDDSEVVDGMVRAGGFREAPLEAEVERPTCKFKDVGGMEAVKDEIRMKIIHPLLHPDLYKAYGKTIGGGILLYGPPGCGKTHLARATAGEVEAGFVSVGINDVLDMWLGNSEKNLHGLFEQARASRPCVLFFDEVDALAASRSDMRQSSARALINQFLAELDGVRASNEGVLILAATNAPWHLDPAFRRPGRFDRMLFVPPPDAPARASILRIHCQGKPQAEIDYDQVGKKTEGFSGADLKAVIDVAVEAKLRDAMKTGTPKPLTTKDLLAAAATLKPSTRDWFGTARNYALYSNQGGAYDDILKYLKL